MHWYTSMIPAFFTRGNTQLYRSIKAENHVTSCVFLHMYSDRRKTVVCVYDNPLVHVVTIDM